VQLAAGREETVGEVHERAVDPLAGGRLVKGLELDEQFVDHARDPVAPAAHAVARPPDGVDLLDEPDGTALGPAYLRSALK